MRFCSYAPEVAYTAALRIAKVMKEEQAESFMMTLGHVEG